MTSACLLSVAWSKGSIRSWARNGGRIRPGEKEWSATGLTMANTIASCEAWSEGLLSQTFRATKGAGT